MAALSRQRFWQLRQRKLGRCETCGQPALPGLSRCREHGKNQRHYRKWPESTIHAALERWQRGELVKSIALDYGVSGKRLSALVEKWRGRGFQFEKRRRGRRRLCPPCTCRRCGKTWSTP